MIFAAVVVLFVKELCCIIRLKMIGGPKTDEAKLIKYQFDNESSGINNDLQRQHRFSNEELKDTQDDDENSEDDEEYDDEESSSDE